MLIITGSIGLAALIAGATWAIRVNSVTARDACIRNLRQIDAFAQQVNTNAQPLLATNHEGK